MKVVLAYTEPEIGKNKIWGDGKSTWKTLILLQNALLFLCYNDSVMFRTRCLHKIKLHFSGITTDALPALGSVMQNSTRCRCWYLSNHRDRLSSSSRHCIVSTIPVPSFRAGFIFYLSPKLPNVFTCAVFHRL